MNEHEWPALLGEYEGVLWYTTQDGYLLVDSPSGKIRPKDGVSNSVMTWAQKREAELQLPTYPKISY